MSFSFGALTDAAADRTDGIELIDNHRYEDAIRLYQGRILRNPEDPEPRVLLASTYAAKNGIILSRFLNVARVIMNSPSTKGKEGIAALMAQMNMVFGAIVALPNLPADQIGGPSSARARREIETGVSGMADLPKSSYGYYLYRAILKLVLMKDDLRFRNQLQPIAGTCEVTEAAMQTWLLGLATHFSGALDDIAKGTKSPEQKRKILSLKAKIADFVSPVDAEPASETEKTEMPPALKRLYPC